MGVAFNHPHLVPLATPFFFFFSPFIFFKRGWGEYFGLLINFN
jgi:hypothetical protein